MNIMTNNIEVYKYIRKGFGDDTELLFSAVFLAVGTDSEQNGNGSLSYSTFILMKEDGNIANIPVELCKVIGDIPMLGVIR